MAIVNDEDGFTQLTKLNITDTLLIQGNEIFGVSTTLQDGQIFKYDSFTNSLVYAGATVDDTTGEWTFDKSINVPSGSVNLGTVVTLSEGAEEVMISNAINDDVGVVIQSIFTDAGSERPSYINLGAEFTENTSLDDSQIITTNPLNFSITGTGVGLIEQQSNQLTLRADSAMANATARVTDNATGVVIRYIPSKAAFDAVTAEEIAENPGLALVSGDNVFDFLSTDPDSPGVFNLGISPFRLAGGQQADITIKAVTMSLKGDVSDFPYLVQQVQQGPPLSLATDDMEIVVIFTTYQILITDDIVNASGTFNVTLPDIADAIKEVTITSVSGVSTLLGDATIQSPTSISAGTSITVYPADGQWWQK